jgi:signal transduction histidine kinase
MRVSGLSLSVTIPLRVTLLVVVTACAVTLTLLVREYDELRRNLADSAASLGQLLATTLVMPLTHDDLWRTFEIVRAPLAGGGVQTGMTPAFITILDPGKRVYASTDPVRFPYGAPADALLPLERLAEEGRARGFEAVGFVQTPDDYLLAAAPVVADGVVLGTLVLAYSRTQFQPRFFDLLRRAGLGALAVLAVLVPLSWLYARRTASPLVRFAREMEAFSRQHTQAADAAPAAVGDELARLAQAYRRMVHAIEEKERLEKQVVAADRLASIGRLAAGVAHEINNPLGGMLNALNTYKRHGEGDPVALRTASLLERGLLQIRDTVSALLVEAKAASHPLTREDIEDARTLALADQRANAIRVDWRNDLHGSVALPSTLVRQVLLNLLLNAEQAAAAGGSVGCHIHRANGSLRIRVRNDGESIPAERMPILFEPFAAGDGDGQGLGLWITYQIVRQMNGSIEVSSVPGNTEFHVCLPIPKST